MTKTYSTASAMTILRRCAVILLILAAATIGVAQAPDRSKPPEVGPPPSLKLPPINHLTLSNGLPVVFMEKHDVPLVQMVLLVRAGVVNDPEGKNGLADLTGAMMMEGAGKRTSLELADAIDYLGASIQVSPRLHSTSVVLHTPLAKLDSALALYSDVALKPMFPSEELERKRTERLTTLLQWHDDPRAIASVTYNKTLFGDAHPYGRPSLGEEKTLRAFQVADLKSFYGTWFHPNNATLIVVGDIDKKTLVPKLEKAFGSWKKANVPTSTLQSVPQVGGRKIYLVDKPGAAQSEIRIGRIGVERTTSDYFALQVLNTILGGSFTSRLNHNLRETHGYTYGAGSGFDYRPYPGPFTARAAVQTSVTDSSLIEFMKELKGIMEPVSDEELTRARNLMTLGYPQGFQSVSEIAMQLSDLVTYKLPDSYFNDYVQHVLAVTKDDVHRVANKYLDPDKIAIVIVGDRSKIESGVAALNLGPIQDYSIDDVLGKAPEMK